MKLREYSALNISQHYVRLLHFLLSQRKISCLLIYRLHPLYFFIATRSKIFCARICCRFIPRCDSVAAVYACRSKWTATGRKLKVQNDSANGSRNLRSFLADGAFRRKYTTRPWIWNSNRCSTVPYGKSVREYAFS